jgi:hypothetical protein
MENEKIVVGLGMLKIHVTLVFKNSKGYWKQKNPHIELWYVWILMHDELELCEICFFFNFLIYEMGTT